MHNGYGAGHVFCLSKAETVTEISVAFEFGMGFVAAGFISWCELSVPGNMTVFSWCVITEHEAT